MIYIGSMRLGSTALATGWPPFSPPMWPGIAASWAADEKDTLARLKGYRRELIDPKIIEHQGRIGKMTAMGDPRGVRECRREPRLPASIHSEGLISNRREA